MCSLGFFIFIYESRTVLVYVISLSKYKKQTERTLSSLSGNLFTMQHYHEGWTFFDALVPPEGNADINFRCCASNPSRCSARLSAASY